MSSYPTMNSFAPALRSQTIDSRSMLKSGLSDEVLQRRKSHRRQTLTAQLVGYLSGALVMAIYSYAGIISPMLITAFLACGSLTIGCFLFLSESGFNDRCEDHYLPFPQVLTNTTVQIGFLIMAPEIGYIFLSCLFVIFSFGALRMSWRQSVIALSLMTLGVTPIFLMSADPVSLPADTHPERIAAAICFILTIGQCAFVGRFGSSLRNQLYKNTQELQLANQRIEELAEIDELTGAHNRRRIMRILDDEISRAVRLKHPCSVALIDIDWFKRINDTFGHPTGDEVLRTFAIGMFANIRVIDAFGRYGGEEFLMVLPETPNDEALRTLNRLRTIAADLDWSTLAPNLSLSISAGVATLLPNETAESVLARADAALYTAKRNGRNRVANA